MSQSLRRNQFTKNVVSGLSEGSDRSVKKLEKLIDINDVFVFTGIGLVGYGLWLIYPPMCWIVIGILFMAIGWLRAGGD